MKDKDCRPDRQASFWWPNPRHYGIASGTVATTRLLGQMTSMAMAAVVLVLFIGPAAIGPQNYPMVIKSIKTIFYISAGLCVAGTYCSFSRGKLRE
ncbi:MAG: hypothetical protein WAU91_19785 [Desulfatitalea sp.]